MSVGSCGDGGATPRGGGLVALGPSSLPEATALAEGALPEGAACYQALSKSYTGLPLTSQQIHDKGLAGIARTERAFSMGPGGPDLTTDVRWTRRLPSA